MKTICVVTGSRAEYGLIKGILERIKEDASLELKLIVTGMHLSYEFGLTYQEIEKDGYSIDEKIEVNLSSDTSVGVCKAMGLGMISFGEAYERLRPDIVVVLGDRYEIFSAVTAAYISKIPVAHIHGGEITEGAFDDSLRHCITKMSYLHFTSTETYRQRVIQLGEDPEHVYNVGALGVEQIKKFSFLSRSELEKILNFKLNQSFVLVTFHPVTLETTQNCGTIEELFKALESFENLRIVFTKSNSDNGGRTINQKIDDYVARYPQKSVAFTSLGSTLYLNVMKYSSLVIGNSSSGIIEAPSLKVPTINIGNRQNGRVQATSTINVEMKEKAIKEAIDLGINTKIDMSKIVNPYEKANTSKEILITIKKNLEMPMYLQKKFYNLF
ncbi:MAG: UDP-N-acetylglucosamine 2-epimerase [Cellulosilyticaceae bacterium]